MSDQTLYIPPLNNNLSPELEKAIASPPIGLTQPIVGQILDYLIPTGDRNRNQLWVIYYGKKKYLGAREISPIEINTGAPNINEMFRTGLLHNATLFYLGTVRPIEFDETIGKISSDFEIALYKATRAVSYLGLGVRFADLVIIGNSGPKYTTVMTERGVYGDE